MSSVLPTRQKDMAASRFRTLKTLEGRRVGLALRGGGRLDDCQLVSVGRAGARSLWVYADGTDAFVPLADVLDIWEAA